jgi:hypothetical protein
MPWFHNPYPFRYAHFSGIWSNARPAKSAHATVLWCESGVSDMAYTEEAREKYLSNKIHTTVILYERALKIAQHMQDRHLKSTGRVLSVNAAVNEALAADREAGFEEITLSTPEIPSDAERYKGEKLRISLYLLDANMIHVQRLSTYGLKRYRKPMKVTTIVNEVLIRRGKRK